MFTGNWLISPFKDGYQEAVFNSVYQRSHQIGENDAIHDRAYNFEKGVDLSRKTVAMENQIIKADRRCYDKKRRNTDAYITFVKW